MVLTVIVHRVDFILHNICLQSLSSQLDLLVKTLRGDGTLSESEVKKFFRQHAVENFQQEMLEFLQSVIETLGEPVLYKVGSTLLDPTLCAPSSSSRPSYPGAQTYTGTV